MLHFDSSRFKEKNFPFEIQVATIYNEFPAHTHDFAELVIILNGFASHKVNNQIFDIQQGDVYLFRGKTIHGFLNVKELELCNIMFNPAKLLLPLYDLNQVEGFHSFFVFDPSFKKNSPFRHRLRLDYDRLKKTKWYIDQMVEEFAHKPPGFRNRITLLLNELILYLSREYDNVADGGTDQVVKLYKAVTFIENNFTKPLSVKIIADLAHLSERQFTRVFKKIFHQTPISFLLTLRIAYACNLLLETDYSVNQVAYSCGFNDPNYFSRLFKKKMQLSPNTYRKAVKQLNMALS